MSADATWFRRLTELRQSFDRGFAAAVRPDPAAGEAVLEIRIAGEHYLLRLAEVGGVFVDRKIVHMPSRSPEFLGLAGIRGMMTPVYDLALLLGHPASEPSRWFVIAAERQVGFAFDGLEAHFRIAHADVISPERPAAPGGAAGASSTPAARLGGIRAEDAARIGERWIPIVNLGVLSQRIRTSNRPLTQGKER